MKKSIKKYIYLINDITSALLKKDRLRAEEDLQKMRVLVKILLLLLIFSVTFNLFLLIKN